MDYLRITDDLKAELEPLIKEAFPGRRYVFDLNHYHDNRFVLLYTNFDDSDIHYEYTQGFVELHLEGKYSYGEYNPLWRKLVSESKKHDDLGWHNWAGRNQGRCRYEVMMENAKDIIKGFKYLISIFDPVIKEYYNNVMQGNPLGNMDNEEPLPPICEIKIPKPAQIIRIKDVPFADLEIPKYQRPYKWGVKNVNQLINDLLTFSKSKEYRLGTLVLNDNKIVDGQQRIVTLSLLLYALFQRTDISKDNPYQELQDNVNVFWRRTKFKNEYSKGHVRENLSAIFERREDLTKELLTFLLENCEFVVVQLKDIGEAFQYFDSQNARGKDLEPHDLLKAFHLREIENFDKNDGKNIDDWQAMDTKRLAMLFISMFRVKRWAKNNSGRFFTKNDIDDFKGISLKDRRFPYYMQQIICNYFSDIYQNSPSRKIDRASFEFPFQLDQMCINGSRFFDMIRHYRKLYSEIIDPATFRKFEFKEDGSIISGVSAYEIITLLNTYDINCRKRTGDQFVRQLFDCLLMYYVDRFGYTDEINKVVRKLFLCAYSIRIEHWSVQLSTIDNDAISGTMFKTIRDAKTPYDIINWSIRDIFFANNSKGEIFNMYNKILGNE